MKKIVIVFALVLFFIPPVLADNNLKDDFPSGKKVVYVSIKGNKFVPIEEIISATALKRGDPITVASINTDIRSIYALGYFSNVKAEFEKTSDGVAVIYKVVENPVLKEIKIIGNSVFTTDEIFSRLSSKIGSPISFAAVRTDVATIDEMYKSSGYVLAKVVDVSTIPQRGELQFKLIEGKIESLSIEGNTNTKDYVILREVNSKPNSVLNEKVLMKDLRRIFNLGFFSEVTPDFQPGSSPDSINLIIKVKENRSTTINFGGGYGEREGWFGFIDFNSENLFGTGQGLLLRGQMGQQLQTYQLRYTYPWLFPKQLGDRVLFSFRRWLTIGRNVYLIETIEQEGIYNGWEVGFSKPFNDEWSAGLTLGSENVSPTGVATFEPYQSDTIGLSLSYDTRDNWMNPSKGEYNVYGIRRGWKYAKSGETNFTKWSMDFSKYYSPFERQTIAARLSLGLGLGDVPVGELYYAGGASTIRGYEPIEARAGTKKIIANLEYRYTFNEMFQGVVFFDWGNAWDSGWPNTYDFISGKGFGVRLNTPMGPIRLDYGIASNRSFSDGVIHFSIGQAF